MKNLFYIFLIIIIAISCNDNFNFGSQSIIGNKDATTKMVKTSDYDEIIVSGFLDVFLVEGKEGNISVKTDDNLHEYLDIKVENNKLILSIKNGFSISTEKGVKITVPVKDISKILLSGSGDILAKENINVETLKTVLNGSGNIALNIITVEAEAEINGSGNIEFKGNTKKLNISISGSGNFKGLNLNSIETNVEIAGSGDANVVSVKTLKVEIVGSGNVKYKGNPKKNIDIVGSGEVKAF